MSCQRRILRIRWFHRVTNAEVTSQTEQEDLTSHIRRRRAAVFGQVRRLPEGRQVGWLCDLQSTRELEAVPTTTHTGSDDQDDRDTPGSDKCRSTPDTGISADAAWDIAIDRCSWRALRPKLVKTD